MTEPPSDTWHGRDLPVLRSIVRLCEASDTYTAGIEAIQNETGLSDRDVQLAARALTEEGLVDGQRVAGGNTIYFDRITGEARRRAGTWPTPESGADRLIAALEHLADHAPTPDGRTRAQKMLDAVTGAGRDIAVGVATAVITGQVS